jgi:hypothetical protein
LLRHIFTHAFATIFKDLDHTRFAIFPVSSVRDYGESMNEESTRVCLDPFPKHDNA